MAERIYDVKVVRTVQEEIIIRDVLAITGSIYEAMEMAEALVRQQDVAAGDTVQTEVSHWDAVCAYPAKSQKLSIAM